jgi:single-stranded DNA-binding protein
MLFADGSTSSKTDEYLLNKETGEPIINSKGEYVFKREYSDWEFVFVGNAFEPAKSLRDNAMIDLIDAWIKMRKWKDKNGNYREKAQVFISNFTLSETGATNNTAIPYDNEYDEGYGYDEYDNNLPY